jgi:carbamoyltransferase
MNLVSIHYGHNCTVTYSKAGIIEFSQSEERFTGDKNATGFPFKSIEYIQKKFQINESNSEILLIDKTGQGARFLLEHGLDTKPYRVFFNKKSYFEKIKKKIKRSFLKIVNVKKKIEFQSGINKYKIFYYDHHLCHAATPCIFKDFDKKKKWIIFTMDAEGDGISSTVYIFENNNLNRISKNNRSKSLGYVYSYTTEILGMRSNEHEFKIMGMAPYGNEKKKLKIAKKLNEKLVSFDKKSGEFIATANFKNFRKILEKIYFGEKFEDICAGVQFFLEQIVLEWVLFWVKKKNIENISLSGGVFMNVKVAKKISELNQVKNLFVTPSCGDESLTFGAIYLRQQKSQLNQKYIGNLYLGQKFTNDEVMLAFKNSKFQNLLNYQKLPFNDINKILAQHLTENKVVGRFSGNGEWGARALGNRSILCDPRRKENIDILNKKIKSRDYWMPFAPSIISEDLDLFYKNKKDINSDFMQISFDATEYAKKNIPAAIHPKDFTLRPQIVRRETNENYYNLIKNFKKLTNVGCVLNTSFNLHGNPNVGSPADAFYTFLNSGLDVLNIENYIFIKK